MVSLARRLRDRLGALRAIAQTLSFCWTQQRAGQIIMSSAPDNASAITFLTSAYSSGELPRFGDREFRRSHSVLPDITRTSYFSTILKNFDANDPELK
jgi:hypothetical protein